MKKITRILVAISGATGIAYAIKLLHLLRKTPQLEIHLVISQAAKLTLAQETDYDLKQLKSLADVIHNNNDIGATVASGSYPLDGMVVIPCSIKSLSAIANCYASDLISRAADVCLKERRKLIIGLREAPLHTGHIELMLKASQYGAILMPLSPSFYQRPDNIDQLLEYFVIRVIEHLGITPISDLNPQWDGLNHSK